MTLSLRYSSQCTTVLALSCTRDLRSYNFTETHKTPPRKHRLLHTQLHAHQTWKPKRSASPASSSLSLAASQPAGLDGGAGALGGGAGAPAAPGAASAALAAPAMTLPCVCIAISSCRKLPSGRGTRGSSTMYLNLVEQELVESCSL